MPTNPGCNCPLGRHLHIRHPFHLINAGQLRVLVNIHLGQGEAIFLRQPFQQRFEHLTGATPLGIEVHHHRLIEGGF
jgi:hypothetical protein